jgi:mRNA-degrading endonuclease RelE of RelBE toxin-antitoxin system
MDIIRTTDFEKQLKSLPKKALSLYQTQEKRFCENVRDPRLHLKRLEGMDGVFSFRITRAYRTLLYFKTPNIVVFFSIGHRKDIYR